MNNFMSFVVNTGTREGDQNEIARYQQYYLAHGVALAAQPQPQGGFLCTMYQPPTAAGANAAQPGYAAQPGHAAQPQQPTGAAQAPAGYAAPAPQADGSSSAYGPPPQPLAAQPGYGTAPQQQHQPYAAAPVAPAAYGAPAQQLGDATRHGFGTPQQYGSAGYAPPPQQYGDAATAGYAAPPPQQYGAAPPPAYSGAGAPQGAPGAYGAAPGAYGAAPAAYGAAPAAYGAAPGAAQPAFGDAALAAPAASPPPYGGAPAAHGASPQEYGGAAPAAYGVPPQEYGAAPAPYGAGFSSGGGPGVAAPAAWAPGAPAPAAKRHGIGSAFGSLSLMQKLKFAGTGIFVLGMAGISLFLLRQAQSNIVLFENSLDVAGELKLAGKSYGSISPRQALRLELDEGSYQVSFSGNGTQLDGGTLTVPKGNSTIGYRAVYNLGGKKGIAVVTKYYGGTFEDRVAPIAEGTRVLEVPGAQKLDRIDDGFPDTITVPKHQSYGTVVRVCHVDEAKGTVGCPGW